MFSPEIVLPKINCVSERASINRRRRRNDRGTGGNARVAPTQFPATAANRAMQHPQDIGLNFAEREIV
jgi:hypothetical protein